MAWISVHDGVADSPKTRKLARILGCGRHEAIGVLVALWQWGLRNAGRDGLILNATEDDIADGIMYKQPAGKLLGALVEAGWIDVGDNGACMLHDWGDWQSEWFRYLDKSETERRRKRDARNAAQGGESKPAGHSADIPT
jgi:hypothetical protein